MSRADGLRVIGNDFPNFLPSQPRASCGVNDEVIHVSNTSCSGWNSAEPQIHFFFGLLFSGSTGRSFLSGKISFPHFLQYQTGICGPKWRCLEISQSQLRLLTQSSYSLMKCAGCHFIFLPSAINFSLLASREINHCFVMINSAGVGQRQQTMTVCFRGSCFIKIFFSLSSSVIFSLASASFRPACLPASLFSLPSLAIVILNGSLYFFHHSISVLSPNVQAMT